MPSSPNPITSTSIQNGLPSPVLQSATQTPTMNAMSDSELSDIRENIPSDSHLFESGNGNGNENENENGVMDIDEDASPLSGSESSVNDAVHESDDAEYESETSPSAQIEIKAQSLSSATASPRPSKRKPSFDENIQKDPELYGLRRSVRISLIKHF